MYFTSSTRFVQNSQARLSICPWVLAMSRKISSILQPVEAHHAQFGAPLRVGFDGGVGLVCFHDGLQNVQCLLVDPVG